MLPLSSLWETLFSSTGLALLNLNWYKCSLQLTRSVRKWKNVIKMSGNLLFSSPINIATAKVVNNSLFFLVMDQENCSYMSSIHANNCDFNSNSCCKANQKQANNSWFSEEGSWNYSRCFLSSSFAFLGYTRWHLGWLAPILAFDFEWWRSDGKLIIFFFLVIEFCWFQLACLMM